MEASFKKNNPPEQTAHFSEEPDNPAQATVEPWSKYKKFPLNPSDILKLQRTIGNKNVIKKIEAHRKSVKNNFGVQRLLKINNSWHRIIPDPEIEKLKKLGFTEEVINILDSLVGERAEIATPEFRNWLQAANWVAQDLKRPDREKLESAYPKELKLKHADVIKKIKILIPQISPFAVEKAETSALELKTLVNLFEILPYRRVMAMAPKNLNSAFSQISTIMDGLAFQKVENKNKILEILCTAVLTPDFKKDLEGLETGHNTQSPFVPPKEKIPQSNDNTMESQTSSKSEKPAYLPLVEEAYALTFFSKTLQKIQLSDYYRKTLKSYLTLFSTVKGDNFATVQVLSMFSEWYKNLPKEVKNHIDNMIEDTKLKVEYDKLSKEKALIVESYDKQLEDNSAATQKERELIKKKREAKSKLLDSSDRDLVKDKLTKLRNAQKEIPKKLVSPKENSNPTYVYKPGTDLELLIEKIISSPDLDSLLQTVNPALKSSLLQILAGKIKVLAEQSQEMYLKQKEQTGVEIENLTADIEAVENKVKELEESRQKLTIEKDTHLWEFEQKNGLRQKFLALITTIIKDIRNLFVHNLDFYSSAKKASNFLDNSDLSGLVGNIETIITTLLSDKPEELNLPAIKELREALQHMTREAPTGDFALKLHKKLVFLEELSKNPSGVPINKVDTATYKRYLESGVDQTLVKVKSKYPQEESGYELKEEKNLATYFSSIRVTRGILKKLGMFMAKNNINTPEIIEKLYKKDPFEITDKKTLELRLRFNLLLEALGQAIKPVADQIIDFVYFNEKQIIGEEDFDFFRSFIDALRDFRNSSTHGQEWQNSIQGIKTLIILNEKLANSSKTPYQIIDISLSKLESYVANISKEEKGKAFSMSNPYSGGFVNYQIYSPCIDFFFKKIKPLQKVIDFYVKKDKDVCYILVGNKKQLREDRENKDPDEEQYLKETKEQEYLEILQKFLRETIEIKNGLEEFKTTPEKLELKIEKELLVVKRSHLIDILLEVGAFDIIDSSSILALETKKPIDKPPVYLEHMGIDPFDLILFQEVANLLKLTPQTNMTEKLSIILQHTLKNRSQEIIGKSPNAIKLHSFLLKLGEQLIKVAQDKLNSQIVIKENETDLAGDRATALNIYKVLIIHAINLLKENKITVI